MLAVLLFSMFLLQQPVPASIRVLDAQGGVVPAAKVTLYRLGSSSLITCDVGSDGICRAVLPSSGSYVLDVEARGFRQSSRILDATQGESVDQTVALEVAGVSSSVVVTASAGAETFDRVAKAVSVIGEEEISVRGEYALAGIVGTAPGVFVRGSGGPGQPVQLRVRGVRPDAVAVLFDGMRFRDASSAQGDSSQFISNLNFIAVDRIELLRGSASSLYGSNAAGGAINMVSDQSGGDMHGVVQGEGGNLGFLRGRAQIGAGALNDRLRYSAGIVHLNVMKGVDGNDRARSTGGQGFLVYDLNPRNSISTRFFGSDDFVQNNTFPTAAGISAANIPATGIVPATPMVTYLPGSDDGDNRRASRHQSMALKLHSVPSSLVNLQLSYQYTRTNRVYINGPAGTGFQPLVPSYSKYAGGIHTLDARSDIQLFRMNRLTAGYEFEGEKYFDRQDNNLAGAQRVQTETSIRQIAHAVYVQDQLALFSGRLQISVSGRAQAFRLDRPSFVAQGAASSYDRLQLRPPPRAMTADVSASYFISAMGAKFRAHFGNAYRAPSLYERFGGGFFSNGAGEIAFNAYGDPYLAPDRYNSFDAGVDQYLGRNRLRLSATYFYTRVSTVTAFDFGSVIRAGADPYGRFIGYINGSGGLSRGAEVGVEARPGANLTLNASYTYTRAHMDRDITVPEFWRVLGVPRHTFSFVVTRSVTRRGVVSADLTANSELHGNFSVAGRQRAYAFPGYVKADLSGSFVLAETDTGGLRLTGTVENVLNRKYYELGWLAPGTTFVTGLGYRF